MVKQEIKKIKEDNSTDIDEQNIAKIINLKVFSNPMTDSLDHPIDNEVIDINKIDSNR